MTLQERRKDGVIILDLRGRITVQEGADALHDALQRLIVQGQSKLILNCEHVPYVDTTGISEIVRAYTSATRRGGTLKLLKLSPHVRQVLTITKLLTVLEAFNDETAALESFKVANV